MLTAIGVGLVVAGVVAMLCGDAVVTKKSGTIGKLVGWPAGRARWLKVVIGLALIFAGVMMLAK